MKEENKEKIVWQVKELKGRKGGRQKR